MDFQGTLIEKMIEENPDVKFDQELALSVAWKRVSCAKPQAAKIAANLSEFIAAIPPHNRELWLGFYIKEWRLRQRPRPASVTEHVRVSA